MFTTKKILYKDTLQHNSFTTKPPRGSEIRSPRATPCLCAPTIPRKSILSIMYNYSPLSCLQQKNTLQRHYNKTPLQQNLRAGLKSGRYGPVRPLAPLQPRPHVFPLSHSTKRRQCNLYTTTPLYNKTSPALFRSSWANPFPRRPYNPAQIDSVYYAYSPLTCLQQNNTLQRHYNKTPLQHNLHAGRNPVATGQPIPLRPYNPAHIYSFFIYIRPHISMTRILSKET